MCSLCLLDNTFHAGDMGREAGRVAANGISGVVKDPESASESARQSDRAPQTIRPYTLWLAEGRSQSQGVRVLPKF